MINELGIRDRKDISVDQTITFLLIFLFATLPFSAIDFSPLYIYFHRALIIFVSMLCVYAMLEKRSYHIKIDLTFYMVLIIFLHSSFFILISGSFFNLKEIIILLSFIFIVLWAKDVHVDFLAKAIISITLFYCLNQIFQYFYGSDLFGFVPRDGRIWGAFYYGSPTFGAFLSFVFFLPFFYLKNLSTKIFVCIIFTVAIVLANDRAPVLQTILAFFVFFPLKRWLKLLVIILALTPLFLVASMEPSASNRLLALYLVLKLFLLNDVSELNRLLAAYGLRDYLDIWVSVYGSWFRWDNLFGVFFGSGWGITSEVMGRLSGSGRPHQFYLELMINWGLFGFTIFLGLLFTFYRRHQKTFVIFAPAVLPFAFFSLNSANYLLMIALSYVLCAGASNRRHAADLVMKSPDGGFQRNVYTQEGRL